MPKDNKFFFQIAYEAIVKFFDEEKKKAEEIDKGRKEVIRLEKQVAEKKKKKAIKDAEAKKIADAKIAKDTKKKNEAASEKKKTENNKTPEGKLENAKKAFAKLENTILGISLNFLGKFFTESFKAGSQIVEGIFKTEKSAEKGSPQEKDAPGTEKDSSKAKDKEKFLTDLKEIDKVTDGINNATNLVNQSVDYFVDGLKEGFGGIDSLDDFFGGKAFKNFSKGLKNFLEGEEATSDLEIDLNLKKVDVDTAQKAIDDFHQKQEDEEEGRKNKDLAAEREEIQVRLDLLNEEDESTYGVFEQAVLDREILEEQQALDRFDRKQQQTIDDEAAAKKESDAYKTLQDNKTAADAEYDKAAKKLARQRGLLIKRIFDFNKGVSITSVAISGVVAIARAFAENPFFVALGQAGIILGNTGTQIAAINDQKAPSLFSGGLIEAGRSAIVGDIPGDFSRAELVTPTSPSAVIPSGVLEKLALGFSNIASSSSSSSSSNETQNNQNQNNQTQNNFYFDTVDLVEAQNEIQRLSGQPS